MRIMFTSYDHRVRALTVHFEGRPAPVVVDVDQAAPDAGETFIAESILPANVAKLATATGQPASKVWAAIEAYRALFLENE